MRLHQLKVGNPSLHISQIPSLAGSGRGKGGKGLEKVLERQPAVMSLDFIKTHTATKEATIDFLKAHRVIRRLPPQCLNCNRDMTFVKRSQQKSGYTWHCPTRRCGSGESPLAGSFFGKTHLAPGKVLEIMWCWANQMPNKTAGNFYIHSFQNIS